MVTSQDIHTVTFNKGFYGYRAEDVDVFLDKVAEQVEADTKKIEALEARNAELKEKLYLLARKVEDYRADEDNLKSALINAQRMGENVIREAKQKADEVLRKANIRADDIVRMATDRANEEQQEYERVRVEVTQFKANILDTYRKHLESLSTLPEYTPAEESEKISETAGETATISASKEPEAVSAMPEEADASVSAQESAASEPDMTAPAQDTPDEAADEDSSASDFGEDAPEKAASSESFWDSEETKPETPAAPAKAETASVLHGIRFTD